MYISHSPGISLRPFIVEVQLASRPSSGEPFRSLMRSLSHRNVLCRSIKQNTGVTCKCLYAAKSFLCYRKALCIVWHIGLTPPQRLRHVTYYWMQKLTVQVFLLRALNSSRFWRASFLQRTNILNAACVVLFAYFLTIYIYIYTEL